MGMGGARKLNPNLNLNLNLSGQRAELWKMAWKPASVAPRRSLSQRSAFQKGRVKRGRKISDNPKNFGNISDKQPFSEKMSDLFFWGMARRGGQKIRLNRTKSQSVAPILKHFFMPKAPGNAFDFCGMASRMRP